MHSGECQSVCAYGMNWAGASRSINLISELRDLAGLLRVEPRAVRSPCGFAFAISDPQRLAGIFAVAAVGVVIHDLLVVGARIGKIAQVPLALSQSPIHIRIIGIQNHRGLEARQRGLPILVVEIIACLRLSSSAAVS